MFPDGGLALASNSAIISSLVLRLYDESNSVEKVLMLEPGIPWYRSFASILEF